MEDAYFVEQKNGDTTTFTFTDFGAEATEEGLDVLPGNVGAGWVREDCFECSLMSALHGRMVLQTGTECNGRVF